MTLRAKLFFAQAPLAIALALLGVVSGTVTRRLGEESRLILADNYRSVLAAERMKESLERINSAALVLLAGHTAEATADITLNLQKFDNELSAQEGNITERGEADVTRQLRPAWNGYRQLVASFQSLTSRQERDATYFNKLQPAFRRVNDLADRILAINQDAMVHKVSRAERRATEFERLVVLAVIIALAAGVVASTWLTTRMLRPLGIVAAAVRRFGDNDFKARADVRGKDEISAVAAEFNRMAARLERYRQSSLGELLQAQQAAQAAIDSLPDPVLLLDANGSLHGVNTAATKLLGIDPERAPAEMYAAADPGVRVAVERLRTHVLGGKGVYVPKGFEEAIRISTSPEGERILLPRAAPIYSESGTVTGAAIVLQDSTRLFRFDELKNNLVATVAHEFRTPLTSLRMALHLCTEGVVGPLTPKQSDLLFAARDDCERLQVIVDELLNLSRIESGQIDLHKRRVDPESLISSALEVHRAAAEQAQVTLATEVFPGLPDVFVDPDRLQLVFTNLLSNAIRFAPAGSSITVRARAERPPDSVREHRLAGATKVRFEIQDQGPGIPQEHQLALFEKFFRVPGSPTGGSGLGLFIARGLVQAHGGEIGVGSEPGQGATFWFTIPAAPDV
ncbi:MAG: two-component system, NtrC family, sensor histidine kinase KinB [Myxococcales bacterium]|jgi:signal transduction histidine kinase|nr:two-component system, NtrC family, sensor histidine kinase KinB [Myxococcales bacterium]